MMRCVYLHHLLGEKSDEKKCLEEKKTVFLPDFIPPNNHYFCREKKSN